MTDKSFWKSVADGMKGNSDALLALAAMVIGCGLLAKVDVLLAFGFPIAIFVIYCFYRLKMRQQDVKVEETKTERSLGNAQQRLPKRKGR